ncbi:uncharacterized protein N0V89_010775 [Didymosphaeria variabile]|uniref:Uncharacterized protein n=1 Tax=Didymosphaeria variabile TaxID=1932322 RepID=A0A9W8XCF7_9PLEO|nr:uncharacterized protein N0V89_010775 [Didymosphaeria variabile]KAJ4346843.1 hypothetical protein N0V89_010775 [Didymosphaeria variabile]
MGGQAFAHIVADKPIDIPRLSPDTYQQVAADVKLKLETLFHHVTIPRDAPEKIDFGDIDFLVEGIRDPKTDSNIWISVKEVLGAELFVSPHHFGIKHPSITNAYVQVDVELSPGIGAELFEWTNFMKSDSDLLQIVGVVHRSLGITCTDKGMHVRVEEVEPYNRKKSMLFLTRDPNQAMEFYGYDKAKYHQGFDSEAEMFDWATNGRYFYWKVYEDRDETSNDRTRLNKRPMFRRFVHEYMPSCGKGTISHTQTENSDPDAEKAIPSRQDVLQEALRMFDKHEEYNAIILEHRTKGVEEALWLQINNSIPSQNAARGTILKGLKRWVAFINGRPYITERPIATSMKLKWSEHVPDDAIPDLLAWIAENRDQIGELEEFRASEARKAGMKN